MTLKPRILIPSAAHPEQGPTIFARTAYVAALERAGGLLLFTGRPTDEADIDALIAMADGLFLMGGSDVDPKEYEKNHCRHIAHPDAARDTLEFALLAGAERKRIPILGICRGLQVMNIWKGGTLYRDIADEFAGGIVHERHDNPNRGFIAHKVAVMTDTLLSSLTDTPVLGVNSLHHQGIERLGAGVRAVAQSPDGLIEAIELLDYPFGLGVQWHPEELADKPSQHMFAKFIEAATIERQH